MRWQNCKVKQQCGVMYLIMEKVLMPVIFIQEFMDVSIANMEMLMASTGKMKYLEVQP